MSDPVPAFRAFLQRGIEAGGFGTDDALAALIPLLEDIIAVHQRGLVAPLDGIGSIRVEQGQFHVDPSGAIAPRKNPGRIEALQKSPAGAIEVVGELRQTAEIGAGEVRNSDLSLAEAGAEVTRPVYLPGYVSWEHRCGHHDQLTDIFSAGLILASLACTLDFEQPADLELFARNRTNLFAINPELHPVVAGVVVQMTELNRRRRVQTLEAVVQRLRHYRDQAAGLPIDFSQLKGYRESSPTGRSKIILTHLRNRLFEISRRNRLIHFRPTLQTLNLTLASVPLLLDHQNIKASQLFLWHDELARAVSNGESLVLGKYLRFEDAPYATSVLDQIIAAERRDRREFGFTQLRLVICFLRWHNLKEAPQERIHSPLLLLPVELTRRKGVRDAYVLKPLSSEAEVNPALRHHLRQLYGLNLPEIVDLSATTLDEFHGLLAAQIAASEPGVSLVKNDRPQIELIHARARQRLDQFRRRQRLAGRGVHRFESFDYSYGRERFRPLGLQLFQHRVKPARPPFAGLAGKPPAPRHPQVVDPDAAPEPAGEKSREFYALRGPRDSGNPYQWDFDLCSLTLGNFNYRKMSLVQDYATLLEKEIAAPAFDAIFSVQPRPSDAAPPAPISLDSQFPVVDCDPTQTLAVARARGGPSYIIQGPPGTGKSQTITNLIADNVARGKRVLFVCEKRAAIDVVFHRLGRQGLDELCCLIHDSQTDKRDFIRNLKQTYETFLKQPVDAEIETRRTGLVRTMELELAALQRWTGALEARIPECSLTVRDLLGRLVELRDDKVELQPLDFERVPGYGEWTPHAQIVKALSAGLVHLGAGPALARHSFRHLTAQALTHSQPLAAITAAVDEGGRLLQQLSEVVEDLGTSVNAPTLADVDDLVAFANKIAPLVAADALDLLNPRGARTRRVTKSIRDWRAAQKDAEKTRAATHAWRERLPPQETATALAQARSLEKSWLRWMSPDFWRLRKVLRERYDFESHALPPSWVQILANLEAEHQAVRAREEQLRLLQEALGELDAESGVPLLERLASEPGMAPAARALHAYLLENPEATYLVERLDALAHPVARARERLGFVLAGYASFTRAELGVELRRLRADLVWLPDVLPLLAEALRLPEKLQQALRHLPLSPAELEAAMAWKSLAAIYIQDRALEATNGSVLARRISRLQELHQEWLVVNAKWIHQRVRREFLRKVQLASMSSTQLAPPEKELKRLYATGRRELEHEFSKTMRYRSIRDLADDETGVVLRDLKPVWLMSPLSVSDTLPLAPDAFDVVIFDEASQILVEEAIPAVFRAPQSIVVGDEMQLPPTNFFSAARNEEEPLDGEAAESVTEDLDADSFLTQSARNLPSTMLGWHYRSRSEALISFSNQSFYEGRLLTIPDREIASGHGEITAQAIPEAAARTDALLERSVSYHFLPEAVYENRRNSAEAEYIAGVVRELVGRETGLSIGIVAFSEAQQSEIEGALNRLATGDSAFGNRLAAEYEREEAGQFCGLFVKNLENVQGDERDIILLSVCYGYDSSRRMLMNFGPINQRGGEKRLNVIFSRARRHMAVISSIHHFDITNDYNDGANCLRNFLEYASACSSGQTATATRVLQACNPLGSAQSGAAVLEPLTQQLSDALRERGHVVETDIGQSAFRLPVAIRREGDTRHGLGILVDDRSHYGQKDLLERYLLRPGVLRAFGWNTMTVYAKDWFHDSAGVIRQIERALKGEVAENDANPDDENAAATYPDTETPAPALVQEPPPMPSIPAPPRPPEAARRFTCTEDGANKFWEIVVTDCSLTVRFGRTGTKGQAQTKVFSTPDAAGKEREKLIRSKLAKGYVEVAAAGSDDPAAVSGQI